MAPRLSSRNAPMIAAGTQRAVGSFASFRRGAFYCREAQF